MAVTVPDASLDPIVDLARTLMVMLTVELGDVSRPGDAPVVDPRVHAAARGDRDAAESLLAELLPRVRNLVRYLTRGDGDVDDIAQEALVAIYRSLPRYRGEGKLESWADRIVARTTFKALHKQKRRREHITQAPDLVPVADDGPLPDRALFHRHFVRILDELPHKQRAALVLHHAVGMSVPEVAETLEVPLETVRSRLRLGTGKLRARMAEQEAEHG